MEKADQLHLRVGVHAALTVGGERGIDEARRKAGSVSKTVFISDKGEERGSTCTHRRVYKRRFFARPLGIFFFS